MLPTSGVKASINPDRAYNTRPHECLLLGQEDSDQSSNNLSLMTRSGTCICSFSLVRVFVEAIEGGLCCENECGLPGLVEYSVIYVLRPALLVFLLLLILFLR